MVIHSNCVHAQYSNNIRSKRQGLAIGPFTTGKSIIQFQSGVVNNDVLNQNTNSLKLGNVIRYGLSEKIELGTTFSFKNNFQILDFETIRVRINCIEGEKWIPTIGVQLMVNFQNELLNTSLYPSMIIASHNKIYNGISLVNNAQFTYNSFYSLIWISRLNFSVTNKVLMSTDFKCNIGDNLNVFNWGVGYFINSNFKIDLSGLLSFNKEFINNGYQFNTGISYRIEKFRKNEN